MSAKSANKRGGQYRQAVYDVIQKTIGRELTTEEHVAVKTVLVEYVKSEGDHFRQSLQKVAEEHARVQEERKEKIIKLKSYIKKLEKALKDNNIEVEL